MKNRFNFILAVIVVLLFFFIDSRAQVTINNNFAEGRIMGWDASVASQLEIRQNSVTFPYYPIEFWTRQLKRMEVNGATGNVGLSDTWTTFNPVDQLHQNIYGNNSVYHRFTNGNSGMGSGDGLRVGITYDGVGTLAEFIQQEHYPMLFSTNAPNGVERERIRISDCNGSLQVYAGNLSSGIYSYSLLADGKMIDTKRMVCQKN
ncbi:MAG: hypothetical protein IPP51_07005 [Bacteroidetes bacterium]|nr:hypothetical protein [Bacteroidota bacterium]